ncbi:MAG: DUF927 domain-containing protein [Candidatus Binataceae bacterium]|jgi:uncharacterized protein (DUF927 family)
MSLTPEAFANQLGGAVLKSGSWYGRCPAHADTVASLKIDVGNKQPLVFKCTSKGCSNDEVVAALKAKSLWPPSGESPTAPIAPTANKKKDWIPLVPVPNDAPACPATWLSDDEKKNFAYCDEDARLLGYVVRIEDGLGGKEFKARVYCRHTVSGATQWRKQGWDAPKPLFGLENLGKWRLEHADARPTVILFEGERKARAAQAVFDGEKKPWVALSISGGTGQHKHADLGPLEGCEVIYWGDAGEKDVAKTLATKLGSEHFRSIKISAGFPDGFDICDAILGAPATKLGRECLKWTPAQVITFIETMGGEFPDGMISPKPEPVATAVKDASDANAAIAAARYFVVLGTDGANGVWIEHRRSGLIANYTAPMLGDANLIALADGHLTFWEAIWMGQGGVDWRAARAFVLRMGAAKGRYHPFADRLSVTAQVREFTNGAPTGYSKMLEWTASDGHAQQWLMDSEMDGQAIATELQRRGFPCAFNERERRELREYIMLQTPATLLRRILSPGWYGDAFALPNEVFGEVEGEALYLPPSTDESPYQVAGTLADWQTNQGRFCVGNDYLVFGVCFAFVGPLLEPLGLKGFGVNLQGRSSRGKTKVEEVGGSVWGNKTYLHSWHATAAGIELLAVARTGTLLALDDTSQSKLPDAEIGQLAYSISNGESKLGSDRDGVTARKTRKWLVAWLSNGEKRLIDFYNAKHQVKAGMFVRLIDIATPKNKFGLFQTIHDQPVGEKEGAEGKPFADNLSKVCGLYYGTPSRHFLGALTQNKAALIAWTDAKRAEVFEMLPTSTGDAAEEVARVAEVFALIAAAGELAIKTETLTWEAGMPTEVVKRVYLHWLGKRGGSNAPSAAAGFDANVMMRQFRSAVSEGWLAHSISRDGAAASQRVPSELWGYADTTEMKGLGYMTVGAFPKIVVGYDPDQSGKFLFEAGLLKHATTHPVRVKAIGLGSDGDGRSVRLWHINLAALFDTGNRKADLIRHTKFSIEKLQRLVHDSSVAAAGKGVKEHAILSIAHLTETIELLEKDDDKAEQLLNSIDEQIEDLIAEQGLKKN